MRAVEILTVQNIVGEHFVAVAALQSDDSRMHCAYALEYKGHPIPMGRENALLFANGVVRNDYEADRLATVRPKSSLIAHKRNLSAAFFEKLGIVVAGKRGESADAIAGLVRTELAHSAQFLRYPHSA